MKTCSLCGTTYDDKVDFCFQDGTPLRKVESAPAVAESAPADPPARPPHDTLSGLDAPDPMSALDAPEATSSLASALDPTGLPDPKGPPNDDDEPFSQVPEDDEPVVSPASDDTGLTAPLGSSMEPLPEVDETGAEQDDEGLTAPLPVPEADEAVGDPESVPFESEDDAFSFGDSPLPADDDGDDFIPYATTPASSSKMPLVLGGVALLFVLGAGGYFLTQSGEGDLEPAPAAVEPPPERTPPPPPPPPPEPEPEPEPDIAAADADGEGADAAGPESDGGLVDAAVDDGAAEAAEAAAAAEAARKAAAREARRAEQAALIAKARNTGSSGTSETATSTASDDGSSRELWQQPTSADEGKINVTSTPAGATVYVDGTAVGTTPTSTTVAYGSHTVKIDMDGYEGSTRSVDVQTRSLSVPFQLKAVGGATGRVNLFGTTGSVVYDGSTKLGTIPVTAQLTEGPHTFKVVLPDGSSYSVTRNVQFPDGGRPVNIPLSPN